MQQCVKIVFFFAKFGGCQKWGFRKENCIFCFFLFYVGKMETEKGKKKWKRPQNPIKIGFFKVVIHKCEKSKKWSFSKNCLTLFVSRREKNAHFRAHYLFWPNFFYQKQCKPGKTIKIVVSAEIAQNQKWHILFEKGVFWHGWKSGFYYLCFWKAVFYWKQYFYSVFSKAQLFKNKNGMLKKQKINEK